MRQAKAIKVKIEQLVLAATGITGVVDDETASWLTGLDDSMYDKLAGVGLASSVDGVRDPGAGKRTRGTPVRGWHRPWEFRWRVGRRRH